MSGAGQRKSRRSGAYEFGEVAVEEAFDVQVPDKLLEEGLYSGLCELVEHRELLLKTPLDLRKRIRRIVKRVCVRLVRRLVLQRTFVLRARTKIY